MVSGLTNDFKFDMSWGENPKERGDAMKEKVTIYGKAG